MGGVEARLGWAGLGRAGEGWGEQRPGWAGRFYLSVSFGDIPLGLPLRGTDPSFPGQEWGEEARGEKKGGSSSHPQSGDCGPPRALLPSLPGLCAGGIRERVLPWSQNIP